MKNEDNKIAQVYVGQTRNGISRLDDHNRSKELLAGGGIVEENGKYILKVTLTFNTPSGASDFVLGGSTNGWTEWKNADGKTLDALYRKG